MKKTEFKNYKVQIDILKNISLQYAAISFDSSIYYANKALNVAFDNNDKQWESSMYANLGLVYFWNQKYDKALVYYNKSLVLKKKINYLEEISKIYYDVGNIYFITNKYNLAKDYFFKGLEISKKNNDEQAILYFSIFIADAYTNLSDYKNSIIYYNNALKVANKLGFKLQVAYIYNWLGYVYSNLSSPEKALKYYYKSLELYKEHNDQDGLYRLYNNLGILYQNLKENDKALIYYKKSLLMANSLKDKESQAIGINNIGTVYDLQGEHTKALNYYKQALKINKELNSKRGIALALNNIGYIYLMQGKYKKATDNITESIKINKEIDDNYNLSNNYNNLANIFIKQKKWGEALEYLQKASRLAKEYKAKNYLQESYFLYSELYTELNSFKKALEYYKLHSELKYNVLETANSNKIEQVKTRFETDFLGIENEILKKDYEIQLLELQKQKNIKKYWIAFSILFLALSVLGFNQFRLKKKHNRVLEVKNNELKEANNKLIVSEKNLKELNATKDKFFSIIAHDIKNPFQTLLGFSELLYKKKDTLDKSTTSEYLRLIHESSKNVYNLLSNLLEWSRIQLGNLTISPKKINLHNLLNNILVLHYNSSNKKNMILLNRIDENTEIIADEFSISTILNNLVSNSIKFTNEGGEVSISSKIAGNKINIMVKDNGLGISNENIKKLFKIDENISTHGTNNEQGTGLGLILCNELIRQNKGELSVESELNKGSTFIITLPLKPES